MSDLALTLALAAGLALPLAGSAAARETGAFDGTWSVELVTESGLCEARYTYALAVQDGQVRPVARVATGGTDLSGRVGADGTVGLNVVARAASGSASGRLKAAAGAGTWTVSGLCSGRWTARRLIQRTAQASSQADSQAN